MSPTLGFRARSQVLRRRPPVLSEYPGRRHRGCVHPGPGRRERFAGQRRGLGPPDPAREPACSAIRPTLDGFAASVYDNAVLHNIVIPPINLVQRAVCQDR